MNKLITIIILGLISTFAQAECTTKQNEQAIPLSIEYTSAGDKAGGSHGHMDKVVIKTPLIIEGFALSGMGITEGEVANFWIPLAYKVVDSIARTEISGYQEEIRNFEVAVYYTSDNCQKSIQRLLR
ncbi:hypothetical protein MED121_24015 [Marinomonas sp. MED121]|uniref:hypothetical protein n=1 Tax=Marinomonas sp. MED121 TaxID=314277 RepID=UPI0000690165|nr:hypothetical protein [Marinomonas sp. MED121]EAQ63076.1 hypothetical protein MED121_24015 [Marinomonas sp. MED121]